MFIVFMGWAPSLCSEFLLSVTILPVIGFLVFRMTVCVLLKQMCSFSYKMLYKMEVQGQNVAWKRKIGTTVVNFLISPWKNCDSPIKFRLLHRSTENRSVSPCDSMIGVLSPFYNHERSYSQFARKGFTILPSDRYMETSLKELANNF